MGAKGQEGETMKWKAVCSCGWSGSERKTQAWAKWDLSNHAKSCQGQGSIEEVKVNRKKKDNGEKGEEHGQAN